MLRATANLRSAYLFIRQQRKPLSVVGQLYTSSGWISSSANVHRINASYLARCPMTTETQHTRHEDSSNTAPPPSSSSSSSSASPPLSVNERLSRLIRKIERLGKENKMATLSHLLKEVKKDQMMHQLLDLSLALAKLPHNNHRHASGQRSQSQHTSSHDNNNSTHRSAFAYIIDSFVKSRSPSLLQLLQYMDTERDAMQWITTNKLILAGSYISSHIRLLRKEKHSELEMNIGFYDKLMLKDDDELCRRYVNDLNLPSDELLQSLSIASPFEKTVLHMHIVTKHLAKWCYMAHFDDAQVGTKIVLLHDTVRRTVKYDPIITSTLMMHNLRTSLQHSVKLVNKFCSSIFFATCVDILQHGGSVQDVKRFHEIVTSNGLVDFRDISYDGYGAALKKLFRGYATTADSTITAKSETVNKRTLTADQWAEINFLLSFICENTLTAAKLRYLFIRNVLSYSFLDIATQLSDLLKSRHVPLGTIVTNHYIRVFAAHGDFKGVQHYIQFASREARKSDFLKPPSQLALGLDPSSLSSFLVGAESYLANKSPHDIVSKSHETQLVVIEGILGNLLDRVEEYRLAPNLKLFQRVIDFNGQCTRNPNIAFQCVNLALRVGKQQPKELYSQPSHWSERSDSSISGRKNPEFNPNFESAGCDHDKKDHHPAAVQESEDFPEHDYTAEIRKFFSDAVLQLCESDAHVDLFHAVDHILQDGYKIEAKALNRVFGHFVALKKYRFVIELFERLAHYDIPRSFEQASAVIEALAKMNRFNDCWRSISSLKPHIFSQISQLQPGDDIQLMQRTKCLAVYASRGLLQLTLLSNGEDGDEGKVKISREELLESVFYCIETIISSHTHAECAISRFETNSQDMLLLHLCLFRLHADQDLVAAVLNELKARGSRAELLIDYVMSMKQEELPKNLEGLL